MTDKPFLRPGVSRAGGPGRLSAVLWLLFFAAAALAVSRYLFGPALSLSRFEIEGTRRARTRDLMAAITPYRGRNLLLLNLAPIVGSVERVAWVGRVTVSKQFPDALKITLEEKVPLALRRRGDDFFWLDGAGSVVDKYDPREEPGDYPVITATDRELVSAARLLTGLQKGVPEYAAALSEIWSLPSGGFGMMDTIFHVPIEVLPDDAPKKIRALFSLRDEIESRGFSLRRIDLRFDHRVVLSGAFGGGKRV
jgi:hypothetical protein